MNSLSTIIGSVIIVISLILAFVGGWEKFHLQKKNEGWLALFIVGIIGIIAGIILVVIGVYSNRAKKINLVNQRLQDDYNFAKSQNSSAASALLNSTANAALAAGAPPAVASAIATAAATAATAAMQSWPRAATVATAALA